MGWTISRLNAFERRDCGQYNPCINSFLVNYG